MLTTIIQREDECLVLINCRHSEARRRQQQYWILRWREQGEFDNLLEEMRMQDAESPFRYVRMSMEAFDAQMARVASALSFLRRGSISNIHLPARDLTRQRYPHVIFITICCLLANAFLCVPAYLSVRSSAGLSVCLFVYLHISLCVCPSVCLSFCLSVCLSIHIFSHIIAITV